MIRVAMEQRDPKTTIGGVDEQRPKAQWRGFGEVFVGIAEAAVDLEGDVELATLLCRLEQQGVAKCAAGETQVFFALRAQPDGAEGDAEVIGVHRLELERRAIGADGFHAGGAALDPGSQRAADRAEPFARVAGLVHEALGKGLEADDLALTDSGRVFLFRERKRRWRRESGVDQHRARRGPLQEAMGVRS